MIEFVPLPDRGRRFSQERRIRLADAGPDGTLRLDGAARILQDVATDDWDSLGLDTDRDLTWVVRRTAMRVAEGGRWPLYGEYVTATTWCGGAGAAWAERRTNLAIGEQVLVEAVALWVPLNPHGQVQRIRPSFHEVYGEATGGRKVPGRVDRTEPPADSSTRSWELRRVDLDIVQHVNNAALWEPMVEIVDGPVDFAWLIHHGPVEEGDEVTLAWDDRRLWLLVEGDVRVSGEFLPRG